MQALRTERVQDPAHEIAHAALRRSGELMAQDVWSSTLEAVEALEEVATYLATLAAATRRSIEAAS